LHTSIIGKAPAAAALPQLRSRDLLELDALIKYHERCRNWPVHRVFLRELRDEPPIAAQAGLQEAHSRLQNRLIWGISGPDRLGKGVGRVRLEEFAALSVAEIREPERSR
jgi:hypothetical protein